MEIWIMNRYRNYMNIMKKQTTCENLNNEIKLKIGKASKKRMKTIREKLDDDEAKKKLCRGNQKRK